MTEPEITKADVLPPAFRQFIIHHGLLPITVINCLKKLIKKCANWAKGETAKTSSSLSLKQYVRPGQVGAQPRTYDALYLARFISNTLTSIITNPSICRKEIFSDAKNTPSKTATTGFT